MRNVLIAPDSFKGTLTSKQVCEIIRSAFLDVDSTLCVKCIPIADGGEGTVDALIFALGGEKTAVRVHGPNFNMIDANVGVVGNTFIIEMAAASGLTLAKDKNPMKTTTLGTGEMIKFALDNGARQIILGIGGSATNDGGIGCAAALGARFLNKNNESVSLNGSGLDDIVSIDISSLDKRLENCEITVLCDVESPLYGENGAAYIFSPQKGASKVMVEVLDKGLKNLAYVMKDTIGEDLSQIPGTGAAGGLGFMLVALLAGKLEKGARAVLDLSGFDNLSRDADLIITGEGCVDSQSFMGKAPFEVIRRAGREKTIIIAGKSMIHDDELFPLERIFPCSAPDKPIEQIVKNCSTDLYITAVNAAKKLLL